MGDPIDDGKFKQEMVAAFQQQAAQIQELKSKLEEQSTRLTPVTSSTSVKMEAGKPSPFTGRGLVVIDRWLYQIELYFSLTNIPELKKVSFAVSFLEESALDWWRGIEDAAQGQQLSWSEFKEQAFKRYRPVQASDTARAILFSLRQTGSVQGYYDAFYRQKQMIKDMAEADQISFFVRGLKRQIAREVLRDRPITLEDAVNRAILCEAMDRDFSRFNGSSGYDFRKGANNKRGYNSTGATPMELGITEIAKEDAEETETIAMGSVAAVGVGQKGGKMSEEEHQRHMKQGLCFRCHRSGHMSRNCPSVVQNKFPQNKQKNE